MEFREYWRLFKRRAWILIAVPLLTAAVAAAISFLSKPEYTAEATVQAGATGTSGTSTQTLSFPEIAGSNTLAIAVIKDLGLNQQPAELSQRIHVAVGRGDLYTVSINDPSPTTAVAIANAVANESARLYEEKNATVSSRIFAANITQARVDFLKRYSDAETALLTFQFAHPDIESSRDVTLVAQFHQLQLDDQAASAAYQTFAQHTTDQTVAALSQANNFTANVLDPAAAKPDAIGRYKRVAYAAGLAVLLAIGLVYLLERADSSVRQPEDAEAMIGAPVIGTIPKASVQTLRAAHGGAA